MSANITEPRLDDKQYLLADFFVESRTSLWDAAWNIAIGQSIGNPNVRSQLETPEFVARHACKIQGTKEDLASKNSGQVTIGYPLVNINFEEDGVSHLLCQLMGGQMDIDIIQKCQLRDIRLKRPPYQGPKYGIDGIRRFTGVQGKPILGGIIKPKTGLNVAQLVGLVEELADGGVNFIKEDEILSNPAFCTIKERVPAVMRALAGRKVIYAVSITSDFPYVVERVKQVSDLGGNAVHINFWSGMGVYRACRDLDLPLFLFFQKSGDRILTYPKHDFHIAWPVICKLAGWMGVDFIHAGMWGGYLQSEDLDQTLSILRKANSMPSLSCGMHPGLVAACVRRFGVDFMANVGGAIHGHPFGSKAGAIAMRQAIDGSDGPEYQEAVKKWGLVE